jgi:predicted permease
MVLMDNFFLIAFTFTLGFILQKFKIFSEDMPLTLNRFVIYISLPALILVAIPKLTFSIEMFIPPFVAWIVMIASALLILLFSRLMHFSKKVEGALMLVGVLTNSSFVGIPMITAYLGEDSLAYLMMYDQLGTAIALGTYGTFVVVYYGHSGKVLPSQMLKKVLIFPPFMALIVAFAFLGKSYPQALEHTLNALASTVIPLALVAAGLQLKLFLPKEEIKPFVVSIGVKLIIAPLVAIAVCSIFGWDNLASHVSIMEAGMAPMITAGAIASMAGLAPRLSSAIVGYGIIFSFASGALLHKML